YVAGAQHEGRPGFLGFPVYETLEGVGSGLRRDVRRDFCRRNLGGRLGQFHKFGRVWPLCGLRIQIFHRSRPFISSSPADRGTLTAADTRLVAPERTFVQKICRRLCRASLSFACAATRIIYSSLQSLFLIDV